jgi:uncharacterized protein YbjT (DUF2867 family)
LPLLSTNQPKNPYMSVAIILGATGLVGRQLTQLLLDDDWKEVHILVRRKSGFSHPKLQEHIIDFDRPQSWRQWVQGDVLFSTLGTTLNTAGSKEAQYKVDYTYQYEAANAAAANGVKRYVLVSAANSSLKSPFFYARMKAELERDAALLPFEHIGILRPGMLAGNRPEIRTGEKLALAVAGVLQHVPGFSFLKPIKDIEVAKAMNVIAKSQQEKVKIYEMKTLFELALT